MTKKICVKTLAAIAVTMFCVESYAQCTVKREDVLSMLKKGVSTEDISDKIKGCVAEDEENETGIFDTVASLDIKNTGNVHYEAITACGYHPQRKELTCPIEIRRVSGYGGAPALQPAGSYEYVLFCVQTPNGLTPVNTNGVHVHDESGGNNPPWQMTAVVPANGALFSQPLVGQTLRARAILSWAVPPANCTDIPTWGNQADFRIRLDP